MKKLFQILTFFLLISFISPLVCSSEIVRVKNIKSNKSIYQPTIDEILKLINEYEGKEYWYGIYSNNEKLGWMNFLLKTYESDKFDQEVFEVASEMNLILKDLGNDGKLVTSNFKLSSTEIYQVRAPFRLIVHHDIIQMDDISSSVLGKKQGVNFKLEYKDNNEKNTREVLLTNFNYSLYDLLAADAWFRKKPRKINDMFTSITFDFQTLENILNETSIQEIIKKKVSGVDYIYYKVNSLDKAEIEEEDLTFQYLIDLDGTPIKFFFEGLELRLESEKNAKNLDQISDIFVNLGVKIENSFPVDFYDKYAEMIVYEVIGDDYSINKKGHQEYKILDDGTKLLTIGTNENQNLLSRILYS